MKKTFLIISFFIFCFKLFGTTYISVVDGNWNTGTNWSPVGIPTSTDVVVINSNIIYSSNLNMGVSWTTQMKITVNNNKTLTINGGLTELVGTNDLVINNGVLNINGDLNISQKTSLINNGTLNIVNGNVNFNQSSLFTNNGVINVNNIKYSGKVVNFDNLNYGIDIIINPGSKFNVIGSNMTMSGYGTFNVNGQLNVIDGNLTSTFSSIIVGIDGGINTIDNDNSGDGIFNINGGGGNIINNGNSYIQSLNTSGGGVTITDNNILFIRDLSKGNFDDGNNVINVSPTGKLYYCGNPVRQEMDRVVLGTVANNGKLFYSKEVGNYPSTTPNTNNGKNQPEQDFSVSNLDQIDMSTIGLKSCADAFKYKLETPLPISLFSFKTYQISSQIKLEWITLSEENNDFFTILKSFNGISFDTIGVVDGYSTTTIAHKYEYIDAHPYNNTNYYKLKQTDFNGNVSYTDVKTINYIDKYEFISIYPNPTTGIVYIETSNYKNSNYSVKVYNTVGSCLINFELPHQKINKLDLDLLKGVYYVSVITEDNTIFVRKIEIK